MRVIYVTKCSGQVYEAMIIANQVSMYLESFDLYFPI